MGIRDYGESLLEDVRKRKDKLASESRKRERKGHLLGLAGAVLANIGNNKLREQYQDFSQNQDILNTNIMLNQANGVNKTLEDLTKKISDSNKSVNDYFLDKTVEETLDSLLQKPENVGFLRDENSQNAFRNAYKSQLLQLEEVKNASDIYAQNYKKALEFQNKFKVSGTKEDAEKVAKSKFGGTFSGLFNQGDKQQEAIDYYRNSKYAKSSKDLAVFDQIFKESGGDFVKAINIEQELNKNALDKLAKVETLSEARNGITYVIEKRTNQQDGTTSITQKETLDLRGEAERVQDSLIVFDARNELESINEEGFKIAKDKGFSMNPTTVEAVNKNNEIFNEIYFEHRSLVLSETDKARIAEGVQFRASGEYKDLIAENTRAEIIIEKKKEAIKQENPKQETENEKQYEERLKPLFSNDKDITQSAQEIATNNLIIKNRIDDINRSYSYTELQAEDIGIEGTTGTTGTKGTKGTTGTTGGNNEYVILEITDEEVANYKNRFALTDVSNEDIRENDKERLENYTIKRREIEEYNKQSRIRVADRELNIEINKARKELNIKIQKELTRGEKKIYRETGQYPSRILEKYKKEFDDLGQI